MKTVSFVALATTLALQCLNVYAAPVGVVVVTNVNGKEDRVFVPVADDVTDPENIRNMLHGLVFPPPEVQELTDGDKDLFWITGGGPGPQIAPPHMMGMPHPHPHPHSMLPSVGGKKPCGMRGGRAGRFRMNVAHKMHEVMNRMRAMLGLPEIKPHHVHISRPVHHNAVDVVPVRPHMAHEEAFWPRFVRAMDSLGPWEGGLVTFVVGLGIGSLIRMVIVMVILIVRGRKAFRSGRCARARAARAARRAARRGASAEEVAALLVPPPAYSSETSVPALAEAKKAAVKTIGEIESVGTDENGVLHVYWTERNTDELQITPATEFHTMYPQELIDYYESHLKCRPADDQEADHETHQ